MFISYNMFIFLIILTVIMIALIVYLTMTAKGTKKQKKTTTSVSPSVTTQEPTQPIDSSPITMTASGNGDTNYLNEHSEHYSYNQTEANQEMYNTTQSEQSYSNSTTYSEQTALEDELYVLPYPKEDKQEDELIYSTSIFKRASQDKNEQTNNAENQNPTNQE